MINLFNILIWKFCVNFFLRILRNGVEVSKFLGAIAKFRPFLDQNSWNLPQLEYL